MYYIKEHFYKNNEAQVWPRIKNNVRTIQTNPGRDLESVMNAGFTFPNKFSVLFFSNSTVSSDEIFQMLRSIEFPLRFIRLDDHKFNRYIRNTLEVISYRCCSYEYF